MGSIDVRGLINAHVGKTIYTMTGRPNKILRVDEDIVDVATGKSPGGQPIPLAWVQAAADRLDRDGEIEISVESVGYRSAFVGAVLSLVPGVVTSTRPRMIRMPRRAP